MQVRAFEGRHRTAVHDRVVALGVVQGPAVGGGLAASRGGRGVVGIVPVGSVHGVPGEREKDAAERDRRYEVQEAREKSTHDCRILRKTGEAHLYTSAW